MSLRGFDLAAGVTFTLDFDGRDALAFAFDDRVTRLDAGVVLALLSSISIEQSCVFKNETFNGVALAVCCLNMVLLGGNKAMESPMCDIITLKTTGPVIGLEIG